jgi:hypothetical protein
MSLSNRGSRSKALFWLPSGVTTASVWTPRRCDILTRTPTGPAPPEPDPMPLVTDRSAACLRTVTVCVHVLLATRFNFFFRLPSNSGSSFNKHSCHRISKLVTCIESSRFATIRSYRFDRERCRPGAIGTGRRRRLKADRPDHDPRCTVGWVVTQPRANRQR